MSLGTPENESDNVKCDIADMQSVVSGEKQAIM